MRFRTPARWYTVLALRVRADYSIHPDGQKFLTLESAAELTSLNVILNWSEELKELVPVP